MPSSSVPSVLGASPTKELDELLPLFVDCGVEDPDQVRSDALESIAYLRGSKTQRQAAASARRLEARWYEALDTGTPDWTVYDGDEYVAEAWACWAVYSRAYLRALLSPTALPPDGVVGHLGEVERVVDVGCGLGTTTAALCEIWPEAHVVGTNLLDSLQGRIASRLAERHGFEMREDTWNVGQADVVFASEFFEHFEEPLAKLREIVHDTRPRALLIANTFNARSIGHFPLYRVDGALLQGSAMTRRFGKEMRRLGYEKVETKMWNGRPTYWAKTR